MVNVETKGGAIITGDNLQIMKAYRGVPFDLVYLDPPYNTGSRSVTYQDKWKSWEEWAAWLEPRLVEIKRLMAPGGLLFASMGPKGVFVFGVLLDKVFGRASRLGFFGRETSGGGVMDGSVQNSRTEFVFLYGRGKDSPKSVALETGPYFDKYKLARGIPPGADSSGKKQEPFSRRFQLARGFPPGGASPDSKCWEVGRYPLYGDPASGKVSGKPFEGAVEIRPERSDGSAHAWLKKKETLLKDNLACRRGKGGKPEIYFDQLNKTRLQKLGFDLGVPPTKGSYDLKREGFFPRTFASPKPVSLLKHLISLHKSKSARILDPFAGSGTTAVAAVDLNREDGGSREFFLIEENEAVVSDLTKPRVLKKINGSA